MRSMNLIRTLVVLVALGLAFSTAACKEDKKKPTVTPAALQNPDEKAAEAEKTPENKAAEQKAKIAVGKKIVAKPGLLKDKPAIPMKVAPKPATVPKKLPKAIAEGKISPKPAATEVKETKPVVEGKIVVIIETNMGDIEVELDADKAPLSVANFLSYVDDKFYDGTIFHRVIDNFMVQGGGFTADFKKKDTKDPIKNEAANGLKNLNYTIAMARTGIVDSATAQFFINVKDNAFLDYRSPDPRGFGYAVFGKVIEGFDVVDKMKAVKTGSGGPFPKDVPQIEMTIKSIRRK